MILPALALQEGFCQHQMACAIMRRKYWPLLTDILQALTSRIHAVTAKDRPLANSPNVPSCLSVPLPWRQLKCSKVFMCRTNSAKEAIVLAHSTQSYRPCTLTPAHSFSNPLLFESGVKTAWNSGGNHRGLAVQPGKQGQQGLCEALAIIVHDPFWVFFVLCYYQCKT